MNDSSVISVMEMMSRRPGWTSGTLVSFVDDSRWSLPEIDLVTFMTRADLQSKLSEAFRLAKAASLADKSSQNELLCHAKYHIHLAKMGKYLLQINYNLPERHWKALLNFNSLIHLMSFSIKVSIVLSAACAAHWPCLSTFELETTDFPLTN